MDLPTARTYVNRILEGEAITVELFALEPAQAFVDTVLALGARVEEKRPDGTMGANG